MDSVMEVSVVSAFVFELVYINIFRERCAVYAAERCRRIPAAGCPKIWTMKAMLRRDISLQQTTVAFFLLSFSMVAWHSFRSVADMIPRLGYFPFGWFDWSFIMSIRFENPQSNSVRNLLPLRPSLWIVCASSTKTADMRLSFASCLKHRLRLVVGARDCGEQYKITDNPEQPFRILI